jgi:glucokinase
MLLAGDVGATKTLLGLYAPAARRPALVASGAYTTIEFESLASMIEAFRRAHAWPEGPVDAAFGVAGPIRGRVAQLTNVPWEVDADRLVGAFAFRSLALLNDLEAMAYSVPVLAPDEVAVLQEGRAAPGGNIAIIAAGTGLGEALLHNVKGRFIPSPSEGGHADFAARTEVEILVLRELTRIYGRVENERILSGPGLVNVHRVLHPGGCPVCDPAADPDNAPSIISRSGLERRCDRCVQTLEAFVSAYGAEAGNHAVRNVATGGVFVGGGIAPKILPALQTGLFMESFLAKDPMRPLLAGMPVSVILNQQAALLGSAVRANEEALAGRG